MEGRAAWGLVPTVGAQRRPAPRREGRSVTNQAAVGVGSRPGLSAATQVSDPGLIARILVLAGRLLL